MTYKGLGFDAEILLFLYRNGRIEHESHHRLTSLRRDLPMPSLSMSFATFLPVLRLRSVFFFGWAFTGALYLELLSLFVIFLRPIYDAPAHTRT